MKTLTVRLPDGTTASRQSDRPYTHAIIVVVTPAQRALVLGKIERTIAEHEAVIEKNAPLMTLPAQAAAYEAAKDRLAFLDEEGTEVRDAGAGKTFTFTCARWLSNSYRNEVGTEDERRRGRVDTHGNFYGDTAGLHKRDADKALLDTARGAVEAATASLETARRWLARESERMTVGRATVYGWSQSAKNALKAEQEARDVNPGAQVHSSTDITVHVPKARGAKAAL